MSYTIELTTKVNYRLQKIDNNLFYRACFNCFIQLVQII